jgi:hypothetical protein
MASMLDYYRDLADKLAAMPGDHARLREEYFGSITLPDPSPGYALSCGEVIEGWTLNGKGTLALVDAGNGGLPLMWLRKDGEDALAVFSGDLLIAAREFTITPLGLALLALAMGGVDDGRLKILLPDLHKACKGLLLIAVCRLCG